MLLAIPGLLGDSSCRDRSRSGSGQHRGQAAFGAVEVVVGRRAGADSGPDTGDSLFGGEVFVGGDELSGAGGCVVVRTGELGELDGGARARAADEPRLVRSRPGPAHGQRPNRNAKSGNLLRRRDSRIGSPVRATNEKPERVPGHLRPLPGRSGAVLRFELCVTSAS